MRKTLIAAFMFCGIISASAQSEGFVRLGVTGGMNVATLTGTEADCRIGFHFGGRLEYGITDQVYVGSGLLFTLKGYEEEYLNGEGRRIKEKGNPFYLQIPIQLGYNLDLGNDVGIFGEMGPYMAFGVGGKLKKKYRIDRVSFEEKEDYFSDEGANTFDFGWGLRFGMEINEFQIHMGYEYGFTKVVDHTSAHNSNFNIGVTYFF